MQHTFVSNGPVGFRRSSRDFIHVPPRRPTAAEGRYVLANRIFSFWSRGIISSLAWSCVNKLYLTRCRRQRVHLLVWHSKQPANSPKTSLFLSDHWSPPVQDVKGKFRSGLGLLGVNCRRRSQTDVLPIPAICQFWDLTGKLMNCRWPGIGHRPLPIY